MLPGQGTAEAFGRFEIDQGRGNKFNFGSITTISVPLVFVRQSLGHELPFFYSNFDQIDIHVSILVNLHANVTE